MMVSFAAPSPSAWVARFACLIPEHGEVLDLAGTAACWPASAIASKRSIATRRRWHGSPTSNG